MVRVCSLFCFIVFWDSKNASIFFNSIFSVRKLNLVGTFERSKLKTHAGLFKSVEKNKKLTKNKQEFCAKPVFNKIDIIFMMKFKNDKMLVSVFSVNDKILNISIRFSNNL